MVFSFGLSQHRALKQEGVPNRTHLIFFFYTILLSAPIERVSVSCKQEVLCPILLFLELLGSYKTCVILFLNSFKRQRRDLDLETVLEGEPNWNIYDIWREHKVDMSMIS